MKRRLKENLEIGDRVFAPKDEYKGTVIDINGDRVLVDGPFGEEYHNINDLEKLGNYDTPDFFSKHVTESKRKKIIRLTESELTRLIERIVSENIPPIKNVIDVQTGRQIGTHQYGVGFIPNRIGMEMGYEPHPTSIPDGTKMDRSSMEDRIFKPREYEPRPMRLRGDSDEDRRSQYK